MAEEDCRKIEVKGISEQTSQETIENYFSSKKHGGEISHIQYEKGKRRACIRFERPEGAQQALQSKPHRIDNVLVIVQRKVARQIESNKLYIEGFPEDINRDHLKLYVENISGADVSDVVYGPRCNAIMTIVGELDFDQIHNRSQTKLLEGKILMLKQVPVCRTILVTGLPPSATKESILNKFENSRYGGGEVECVQMNLQERTALVEFIEPTVLHNVLSQDQTLDDVQLTIKPYHSLLGGLRWKQPHITSGDPKASEPVVACGQPSFPSTQPGVCEPAVVHGQPTLASTKYHVKIDRDLYNYLEKKHPQNLKLAIKNSQPTVDEAEDTVVFAMETNEAENELKAFLKDYKCEVVEFDAILADRGLHKKMLNIHQVFESSTAVLFLEYYSKGYIKIVGRAVRQHTMAVEQVEKCVNETKKEYEEETKQGEELIEMSRVNLKLLQSSEKFRASERAWTQQGVNVRLVTDSGVLLKGSRNQVNKVKNEIEQLVGSFSQRELDPTSSLLLMSRGAVTYVMTLLVENDLKVEISTSESKTTTLYGFDQANIDEAYQYIVSTVREVTIPLSGTTVRRQEFQEDLVKSIGSSVPISLHVENDELRIVCFEKDLRDVHLKATNFLEGKKHKEVHVPFEKAVGRYLQLHGENILEGLRLSSPEIAIELRPDVVIVSGAQPLVASCEASIKEVIQGLSMEKMNFGKPETCTIMTGETAEKIILGIEQERTCAIVVNVSEDSEERIIIPAARSTDTEKMKELMEKTLQCRYTYPNGKIIEVHQGDILDHPVDFLVNAANAELKHGGGIAKAIVDKGGHKIQEDCFNILKERGKPKLMPCDVVVTDAGDLLCNKVLHVVVPKWKGGSSNITEGTTEGRFLRHACLCVLNEAKDGKTIAMPALGTGIYIIPHAISAKSLVTATDEFVRANTHCGIKEIHFVDNEPKAIEAFMKEMMERYGSDSNFYINERVRHRWSPAPRIDVAIRSEVLPGDGSVFSTKEGMKIQLTIGNIATCEVDVIVNTVHGDMDLTKNPCSKAILQDAGQELTKYCEEWAKKHGELKQGCFVVTGGAKLKCKKVFHVHSPLWKADDGEKKLGEVVKNLLSEASRLKLTSIAIPALGTGKLRYPEETVAKVLFEEAIKFSANQGASVRLKQVDIVVYNGNATAVEKFKEKFQFYSTKRKPTPNIRRTRRPSSKNSGKPSETPPRRTSESYETRERPSESTEERVAVESNDLQIEIVQGDMVEESTDAIALLVGSTIMQSGQLGVALKLKAGVSLTREYANITKVDPGTVVVTSAGDLKVKCLLHMVPKKTLITDNISSKSIREAVIKCLEEADFFHLESISLPAVGTGVLKKDSEGSAGNLHASISEYAKRPSGSLKLVRIVILQPNVFDEFRIAFMKIQRENPLPRCSVSVIIKSGDVAAGNNGSLPRETAIARKRISLDIVGDRSCNMEEIKRDLSRIEQERCHYKDIDHEVIAELPQTYLDEIIELQNSHFVQIEWKQEMGYLRLSGLSENVAEAAMKIYERICAYSEEKRMVKMSSQAGQWLYYDGSDGDEDIVIPEPYPEEISGQIEKAYQENLSSVVVECDVKYKIDFRTMVETNLATEDVMNVYRSSRAGFPLPEIWDCQPIARATAREEDVHLVHIDHQGQPNEFDKVYDMFNKSMPNATVESIQRIQNPGLYQGYKSQEKKMNGCGGCNEQKLFHGTTKETMKSINSKGFNRSYCGKNATRFGKGVYFAREAKYSSNKIYAVPDENGVQYMYVAQVLVGRFTKGKRDLIVPPPIDDNNPNICYDTVVDDVSKPTMFVVFYDYQCYPQYLISFKDATK